MSSVIAKSMSFYNPILVQSQTWRNAILFGRGGNFSYWLILKNLDGTLDRVQPREKVDSGGSEMHRYLTKLLRAAQWQMRV